MRNLGIQIQHLLDRPFKVLFLCLGFFIVSLTFTGGLLHLYNLHRDISKMQQNMAIVNSDILDLNEKLTKAKDPNFMGRQALDNLEMGDEKDLVFVFADE